jgi:hypothetical protein
MFALILIMFFSLVMLKAGSKKEVTVTFKPEEAKVTVSTAIFKFKEGEKITQKVLKMSGIGKFPFINASDEKINFDQLTVGQQETKHITLRNYSLVTSKFEIEKINDDGKDLSFALSQKSGDIAPGSSQKITVTYTPTQVGAFTSTQYEIRVVGGNVLKLVCSG